MHAPRTADGAVASPSSKKLKVTPTTMTFTKHKYQQAYMSPNTDFYTEKDTCKGIATATYFSYGIWKISPGTTNGSCGFTFKDTVTSATAKMKVVNSSN